MNIALSSFTNVSLADVWWVECQRAQKLDDPKLNQCERPVTQTHMFQSLAGVGDVDRW